MISASTPIPRRTGQRFSWMVMAPGGTQLTRDYPILNWVVRYNSGDCSGPESASGNAFFGRSSTIWQPLTAPLFIIINPAPQWTWNTTIELRLDVAQNPSSPLATSLSARFDEIEIGKRSNVMFADSFEAL